MSSKPKNPGTKVKLLEAGGEIIASKGFHAASVREVCDLAGANVAAISYHFGDKEKLHEAILEHVFQYSMEKYPIDFDNLEQLPAADAFRKFVHSFMLQRLDPDRPEWHRKIIAREITDPSKALQRVFPQRVMRHFAPLKKMIKELTGNPSPETVEHCVASVIGQCVYFVIAQKMIPRIYKFIELSPEGVTAISDHIVDFTLAAMEGSRFQPEKKRTSRKRKGT